MLHEVLQSLQPSTGCRVLDGTFGRGGHTRALLRAGASVVAMDRDPEAARAAQELMRDVPAGAFQFFPMNFRDWAEMARNGERFDGLLLDLGVSSPQLDEAYRGFSFMKEGPLDMRMDPSQGATAADLVQREDAQWLETIFREYGEERRARAIANAIVRERKKEPIRTTLRLADIVEKAVGGRRGAASHPATRVFQALRIAVNDELNALSEALRAVPDLLLEGGRLAVISFHSLEDRIVKRFIADRSMREIRGDASPFGVDNPEYCLKRIGDWAPKEEEVARNPRARSARLRVAERVCHVA